jgi:hypothetical protein
MSNLTRNERQKGDRLRKKILKRDDYKCHICGSEQNLEVHHMQALVYGGKSNEENLVTLCDECHRYAPEDSIDSNQRYLKERNKQVYQDMMKMPEVNSMVTVAFVEFLKERVNDYVSLGFIDQQQANFIMIYETSKVL